MPVSCLEEMTPWVLYPHCRKFVTCGRGDLGGSAPLTTQGDPYDTARWCLKDHCLYNNVDVMVQCPPAGVERKRGLALEWNPSPGKRSQTF